jgi:hypothetical protein
VGKSYSDEKAGADHQAGGNADIDPAVARKWTNTTAILQGTLIVRFGILLLALTIPDQQFINTLEKGCDG